MVEPTHAVGNLNAEQFSDNIKADYKIESVIGK